MVLKSRVPKYKITALAHLKEMEELGVTEADIRKYLTPRQIHGYHTGLFLSRSRAVPNMHNVALSIVQSKNLGRKVTYHPPDRTYWWQEV